MNNKTKHTPGPLYIRPPAAQGMGYNIHASKSVIVGNAKTEKDAALWAAASEMLDALEAATEAISFIRNEERNGSVFGRLSLADDKIKSALAKARGEA